LKCDIFSYLKSPHEEDGLQRIIHPKVETTVDNDADTRDDKASIEPSDAI
jgi:hypothetical protein